MNWRDTVAWLVVGMTLVCLLLVAVDRAGAPGERRPFRPAVRPRAVRGHHLRRHRPAATAVVTAATTAASSAAGATPTFAATTAGSTNPGPAAAGPQARPHSPRLVAVLEAWPRPPRPVQHPWAPGDNLHLPLVTGAPAGPPTVRKRAWTAFATIAPAAVFGTGNVERLERGRAPMRYNPLLGGVELMEIDVDATGHVRLAWPDSATPLDPFAAAP